jgi:predicted metal-dependent hydrolase
VLSSQLQQGIQEFNQRSFYACHDTLEAIWIEAETSEKRFYQGILQVAVGCYHLGNHNWRGAVISIGEGVRRLRDYTPEYQGVNVEAFLDESLDFLATLQQLPPEKVGEFASQLEAASQDSASNFPTIHWLE